jgi:type IX secretion system PorP/SprF family membrane protein
MMKKTAINIFSAFALMLSSTQILMGQEPGFMQYNADPLNISPALTGRYDTDLRVMVNARSQWLGKSSTYNTRQATVDAKIFEMDESNYFGIGGMFISDKAMDGLYKSNYFSLNGSYHFALDANGNGLGLGIGVVGNNTRVDFSQLTFDQQLGSSGFDLSIASGETAMRNGTSHVSATAGVMYTYETDYIYFDAGVSGYRFINFQRSFYNDPKQTIAPRYTAHAYLSMTLNDRLSLQASAMQMIINRQNITMAGAMLGIILAEQSTGPIQMLHLGTHYRSTGAIAPTVGYTVGNIDLGLSSDVNMSSKTSGSVVSRAIELTLAYNVFSGNFRRKVGRYHLPY